MYIDKELVGFWPQFENIFLERKSFKYIIKLFVMIDNVANRVCCLTVFTEYSYVYLKQAPFQLVRPYYVTLV